MNQVEKYLRERWNQTHWPYYGYLETKYLFKESFDRDIKELREKDMIEPCAGLNGWLIKIINLKKW